MVQPTIVMVKSKQQRTDALAFLDASKTPDDAIGGSMLPHLQNGTLAGSVTLVQALRHHTVQCATTAGKP